MWYPSKSGDNANVNQRASGAYIFRPDGNAPLTIPSSSGIKTTTYSGIIIPFWEVLYYIHAKNML